MSNPVKKVLRKAKKTHLLRKAPVLNPFAKAIAKRRGILALQRDKNNVRDANFNKALGGLKLYRERIEVEKKRQEDIATVRLKNLTKARRAKEKKNNGNLYVQ